MQVANVTPNTPEWLALRAQHFCASDAATAMGVGKYKTREQFLREKVSGIAPDVSPSKQRLFDGGHAAEKAARPLVEGFLGEDLYPCVVTRVVDGLPLLASLDGHVMDESIIWESKQYNAELARDVQAGELDPHYWAQLEHQLLVSEAEKVYFTTTDGTPERMVGMWYVSVPERRAKVIAAWKQFAEDMANYVPPEPPAAKIVAEPVEALPAPVVQVTGQLALQDNFKVFEDRLRDFLAHRLIREPKTDEDFVNLDAQIKAMKAGREALKSAKAQMLAQVQPIDQAGKTADMLDSLLQQNCKLAEDLLKNEKERRREQIVAAGVKAFADHIATLNKRIGRPYMPAIPVDFGGCVKGLKSLSSMEEKVSTHLANAKIAANDVADRIQINMATLRELAADHVTLFPDTAQLVLKGNDDLTALVKTRIAEHLAAEQRRADALAEQARERIAAEERAKAEKALRDEREARDRAADLERRNAEAKALEAVAPPAPPQDQPVPEDKPTIFQEVAAVQIQDFERPAPTVGHAPAPPTMTNGKVCQILGFTVTAEFLTSIGAPAPTKQGNANLWHDHQIMNILEALGVHMSKVYAEQKAKYQPARSRTPA